jgi:hypothetical protein
MGSGRSENQTLGHGTDASNGGRGSRRPWDSSRQRWQTRVEKQAATEEPHRSCLGFLCRSREGLPQTLVYSAIPHNAKLISWAHAPLNDPRPGPIAGQRFYILVEPHPTPLRVSSQASLASPHSCSSEPDGQDLLACDDHLVPATSRPPSNLPGSEIGVHDSTQVVSMMHDTEASALMR